MKIKMAICTFFGAIGTFVANAFGGWSEDMVTLLIFMGIDFAMGLVLAGVFKKSKKSESGALESNAGFKGLCKKCVILFFVLIAYRLDVTLGTAYIKTACIIGFIINELISIAENAGLMGINYPDVIKKAIGILKDRQEK